MDFTGPARPLTPLGMSSALGAIGFLDSDVACIWAVIEVETASITQGFGFLLDRRRQILFERNKLRDVTNGLFTSTARDISGPVGGYGGSQYPRIDKALRLCQQRRLGVEPAL